MVNESSDVRQFLSQQALFGHLDETQLNKICNNCFTAFEKSGRSMSVSNDTGILVVRSGSLDVRESSGELLDRLSEGDFLIPDYLAADVNSYQVTVLEDCLYYEVASAAYQSLYTNDLHFAYLCDSQLRRLRVESHAVANDLSLVERDRLLAQRVEDFMVSPAICVTPDISIRAAAEKMKEKNISSLLICDGEKQIIGIVTDRDLRTRVLAEGVEYTQAISTVMTTAPKTIEQTALLHQAQITMMTAGIHHLPVVSRKQPVGLIGLSDVVRANNIEPVSLVDSIKHAQTAEVLRDIAAQFPALVARLIERDTRAVDVGEIITSLTDGITRRLIALAQQEFGTPPSEFVWLAFGSQARQEQVLGSDQDNALILLDTSKADDDYFKRVAEFVNEGLHHCGFGLCPGEIMARNPKWRMDLDAWINCFCEWIEKPSPKALMHASIFFDMRLVQGPAEVMEELRAAVLEMAKKNTIFLALMVDNALSHSPPLGFFKNFVLEKDGDHIHALDLKKRGTIPIVDIARNYSLSAGLEAVNTTARLEAIADTGKMSKSLANSLIDAHEFIAGLRLDSQGKQFQLGQTISNHLDPKTLSPLVRHQLKDAFHLVRQAQAAMKARFSGGLL